MMNIHLVVTAKKTNHLEKDYFHKGKPLCTNFKKFGHREKDCRYKEKKCHANDCKEDHDHLFFTCQAAVEDINDIAIIWHLRRISY